ncbi:MAG: histidine phosphatase family protein [Candidatus Diapherotrites archaeon]|uniref:Histidine phosphatase family protein n=1 Tax=Candidatus Iainarchaeum sp. TaxID=3101447 RepID=A0A8T4KVL0_9ARCH|nr:histidine phosphatase family protein [Candidatus Diapherotrites archaeon]
MLELILARHGQTFWNKECRFQGWKDSPLTERGVRQAKKLAEFLQGKNIDFIFSSDLGRAKETAAFIIQHHPESMVEFVKELREISFGLLEGKTWQEAADKVPSLFELETKDSLTIPHPRGESFEQLKERVEKVLEKILKLQDRTVLLVSHEGVCRTLLQILFNLGFEERGKVVQPHEIVYLIRISGNSKECEWFNIETGEKGEGFFLEG